jgi:hypothetical protein
LIPDELAGVTQALGQSLFRDTSDSQHSDEQPKSPIMRDARYSVLFEGKLREGVDERRARNRLAAAFGLSADQIQQLFATAPVVLRRQVTLEEASRLAANFNKSGAQCRIVRHRHDASSTEPIVPELTEDAAGVSEQAEKIPSRPTMTPQLGKRPQLTPDVVPRLFHGKVNPRAPRGGMRLRALLTAGAVIILPALYLMLVLLVGVGGVFLSSAPLKLIDDLEPAVALAILGLSMTGVALVLMLKPLLAAPVEHTSPLTIKRRLEPVLFAFVDELSRSLGAPRPSAVEVDADLKVAARPEHGWRGLLRPHIRVTIGLPLIAGLSARQLAGVLAREIGPYATVPGMEHLRVIKGVLGWLDQAANGTDHWDQRLVAAGESEHAWMRWPAAAIQPAVDLQRRFLDRLYELARAVSGPVLTKAVGWADKWQAEVAGSDVFRATAQRLFLLQEAHEGVYDDLSVTWADRSLVDDFPSTIAARSVTLESEYAEAIDEAMEVASHETGRSLLPDAERIELVETKPVEGIFQHGFSARFLLNNYSALARLSTEHFYRETLGLNISREQLLSREAMATTVRQSRRRQEALESYFRDWFLPTRFTPLPSVRQFMALSTKERVARLNYVNAKLRRRLPDIQTLMHQYQRVWEQTQASFVQRVEAGGRSEGGVTDAPTTNMLRLQLSQVEEYLHPYDHLFCERLAIALGGTLQEAAGQNELVGEIKRLLIALYALAGLREAYDNLRMDTYRLLPGGTLEGISMPGPRERAMIRALDAERIARIERNLGVLRAHLRENGYPFEGHERRVSMLAHIEKEMPPPSGHEVEDLLNAAGATLGAIQYMHVRIMGRLALLAAQYEASLGIEPIKLVAHGSSSVQERTPGYPADGLEPAADTPPF